MIRRDVPLVCQAAITILGVHDCVSSVSHQGSDGVGSRNIQFDIVDCDIVVRAVRIEDATPIDFAALDRFAFEFGLPLAFHAQRRIRKGRQSGHGNVATTVFANPVLPFVHPLEGLLDACQLPALDLGKLRADLVLDRVEREVNDVAAGFGTQLAQEAQIAGQRSAKGVPPLKENLTHVDNGLSSVHWNSASVFAVAQCSVDTSVSDFQFKPPAAVSSGTSRAGTPLPPCVRTFLAALAITGNSEGL